MLARDDVVHWLTLLTIVSALASCASPQRAYDKTLRSCRSSGDAGRRVEKRYGVGPSGQLLEGGGDRSAREITELRDDCLFTVTARTRTKRWELSGLSWAGDYVASRDGERVAFTAQDRAGWHVVVDGELGPAFDGTSSKATFSNDGQHVMFVGYMEGSNGHVFVDGREVARAPFGIDHGAHTFTSDGRYLIALRTEDGGLQVSAGGVLGPRFDSDLKGQKIVSSMTWLELTTSASGGRFAYVGTRRGSRVLVVDGREVAAPDGLWPKRPLFSATGRRLIYMALPVRGVDERPRVPAVVIDGVAHPMPGLTDAVFTRGEIPLVICSRPLGMSTTLTQTVLFGVDRLDQRKPRDEPEDRIVVEDRAIDPEDIDVRADGVVTFRGTPIAAVRGRRAPVLAE
jgi:hypothetical protein